MPSCERDADYFARDYDGVRRLAARTDPRLFRCELPLFRSLSGLLGSRFARLDCLWFSQLQFGDVERARARVTGVGLQSVVSLEHETDVDALAERASGDRQFGTDAFLAAIASIPEVSGARKNDPRPRPTEAHRRFVRAVVECRIRGVPNRRGIEHRSSPRASSPAAARAVSTGMSWEIDWSVGRVVATLRKLGLDKRTIVVFLSDNGPWALFDEQSGSAGPFRGSKGGTMEGGVRVPAIFWGPGIVRPGVITDMGSTLDLVPTLCTLTGARAPQDRTLDGYDLSAVLRQGARSPRETMFFYRQTEARN